MIMIINFRFSPSLPCSLRSLQLNIMAIAHMVTQAMEVMEAMEQAMAQATIQPHTDMAVTDGEFIHQERLLLQSHSLRSIN